ncbi:MAG TPA: hypothetical protein VGR05_04775 [Sphingomicrobium sp.]|nr:hypothetical protein [Sphingomicrobium sp.]
MFRTVRHWWQGGDGKTTARLFGFELFVVVVGVLIALGAEQLVSNWHWQGEVRDSDRRISDELGDDLANAYERLAINDCLEPRLAELRDELIKAGPIWTGSQARFANDIYNPVFPPVYRTPNRPWPTDVWETAVNGETLGHFRPERVAQFAALFDEVYSLQRSQSEELDLAASLGDLAFTGPISPAERRANLKLVAQLGALNARIVFQSRRVLKDAADAGLSPDPEHLRESLDEQRRYRGNCVRGPDKPAG